MLSELVVGPAFVAQCGLRYPLGADRRSQLVGGVRPIHCLVIVLLLQSRPSEIEQSARFPERILLLASIGQSGSEQTARYIKLSPTHLHETAFECYAGAIW